MDPLPTPLGSSLSPGEPARSLPGCSAPAALSTRCILRRVCGGPGQALRVLPGPSSESLHVSRCEQRQDQAPDVCLQLPRLQVHLWLFDICAVSSLSLPISLIKDIEGAGRKSVSGSGVQSLRLCPKQGLLGASLPDSIPHSQRSEFLAAPFPNGSAFTLHSKRGRAVPPIPVLSTSSWHSADPA